MGEQSVFRGRSFLGRIERFGTARHGELRLFPDAIQFTPREGQGWRWHFDRLTAVQPSSSALQLKASGEPVVSLRFPDSSVRLWEDLVQETLRAFYRRTGRGEIVEMQPRIIARP